MSRPLLGGRTTYGQDLGILMLDTRFERLRGDVGNASTWPFPVRYKVVTGATSSRIMGREPDPDLIAPFVAAARELEADGVTAITTSCGFLAAFQPELAAAVTVPVVTSALLQVPLAARMIGPDRRVGILTERPNLTEAHFRALGWSSTEVPVVIRALPDEAVFPTIFIDGSGRRVEPNLLEAELVSAAAALIADAPDVGAIVLECTNFVPFSAAMRRATGRAVFDLYTLVAGVSAASREAAARGG
jgi:hypothetical protein